MNVRCKRFLGVIGVALTFLVQLLGNLLDIPKTLGEHAAAAWIDDQIGEKLGIHSPSTDQVVEFMVTWAPAAILVAVIFFAGWVSHAIHRKKAAPISGSGDSGELAVECLLRIDVGEAGEFFETSRGSLYTHKRILKLKVSNSDQHTSLTGCKVYVTDISPHEYDGPWLLKEGFSLAPGDHEFVPLVSYTEPDNIKISAYGATFMEILATKNQPKPSSKSQHILTIRATALGSPFCEIKCKLWVDDTGRLRIEATESLRLTSRISANTTEGGIGQTTVEGYEKRYAFLKSTRAFLNEIASNALVSDEALRVIRRNAEEAPFLFDGDDLPAYLSEISRRANIVQSITYSMRALFDGDDKARASAKAGEHRVWLLEQDQQPNSVLTEKFRKVLRHP